MQSGDIPSRDRAARRAWAALRPLRRGRYDVALDFGGLWKSAAWARLSGAAAGDAVLEVLDDVLTGVNYSFRSTPTTSAAVVDSPGLKREGVSTGGDLHFRMLFLLARRPWAAGRFASAWASAVR